MKENSALGVASNWRLEAVYADPSNDRARLDYAQWAHEQGNPHGEFVRLQMLATKRRLFAKEAAKEAKLLAAHGRHWLGPLACVTRAFRFRRGFPADLVIFAERDSELAAIEGHPAYSTIERLEFEHVQLTRCRRRGWSEVGLAHPVFRALQTISGIYGDAILEACRAHRQLEALAWFVPPEDTGSMAPSPTPVAVARAVAELPALKHIRVGNDVAATDDDVDQEIAAILLSGRRRPARVSVTADPRMLGWLRRMQKHPAGELEIRSDGCGTISHPGMTLTVRIVSHAVHRRAHAVFTPPALRPEQYEVRAFTRALALLAGEGVDVVEVTVPDPSRNGPLLLQAVSNVGPSIPMIHICPETQHE